MQIFSYNPSQGKRQPEFINCLKTCPPAWDETIIEDAKVGGHIVTVRKKGDDWFVAGMSNWTPGNVIVKLDFLGTGNYKAKICKDGLMPISMRQITLFKKMCP